MARGFSHLRIDGGFWFLATVYSRHPYGPEAAFKHAVGVSYRLLQEGVSVYSPIVHSHPIAMHNGDLPTDAEFWWRYNLPFMEAAHGLIVMAITGWQESVGIAIEIEWFENAGKPVEYIRQEDF